jgi:outer membrane receptor protein involved in Fe transport
LRVERYDLKLNAIAYSVGNVNIDSKVTDWLPSGNLIYALTDKSNLRSSYSITISRPEFREVAPFSFYDVKTNALVQGQADPSLVRTKIQNFDIKYEYFPTSGSMISFNPFVKLFDHPIETFSNRGEEIRKFGYMNIRQAISIGFETDFRINLKAADKWFSTNLFKDFQFFMNYALIYSSADLSHFKEDNYPNHFPSTYNNRPMQGQSPYVLNAGLQYTNQKHQIDILLTLNRSGRRIAYTANDGKYILWENPRTDIDFSISKMIFKNLQAKFMIGDLLHQPLIIYSDFNFSETIKFKNNIFPFTEKTFDSTKDFEAFKYQYGSTFTIMANFTF